ncbi:MAG: NIPSNAP family protein, partial [Stellaceae bacterium]
RSAALDRRRRGRHAAALQSPGGEALILEIRTYTAAVGKTQQWLDYYGKNGLPIQQEMLGKLIFFGTSEIGTLNQITHIWAYNSLAEREQKRGAMAKDPRWQDYLKNQPPGALLVQETKILNPVAFSPLK